MRINSTGRKKIPLELVSIRVLDDGLGQPAKFTADLSRLSELNIDVSARIIVEPYVKQSSMRFDFGTIANPITPADTTLYEIDRGAAIQFRVKVVDTSLSPGRLIASAERIRPHDEEESSDRRAILPLHETDLGDVLWKIEVSPEEAPYIAINRRVPGFLQRMYDDPVLQGAILSIAARDIVRVILKEHPNEEDDWVKDWRSFAEGLLNEELPESVETEAAEELVSRIVESLCSRQGWVQLSQPGDSDFENTYE